MDEEVKPNKIVAWGRRTKKEMMTDHTYMVVAPYMEKLSMSITGSSMRGV
jgi:hypothetical protein